MKNNAFQSSQMSMHHTTVSIPDVKFHYGSAGILGVELIELSRLQHRAASYKNPPDKPHRVLFHCLCFPRYSGTHEIDFKTICFNPDDILYVGSGQVHAWNLQGSVSGYALLIGNDFMTKISPLLPTHLLFELRRNGVHHCQSGLSDLINQILGLLDRELKASVPSKEIELLVAHLFRMIEPDKNENAVPKNLELFRKFCELAEKHCTQTRNVGFYAKTLNLTPETLNRLVQKMAGASAKRWIDRCVLLLAQRRLVSEKISIEKLSAEMGFSQPTHFIKFFTRLWGDTPGHFQRGNRR